MSKLTDRLSKELGIYNTPQLARAGEAKAWIEYFTRHPHALGHSDHRATVFFRKDDGKLYKREFRPKLGAPAEMRQEAVRNAQVWANERFGVTAWIKTPYTNSWIPREAYDRVMAQLPEQIKLTKRQRFALQEAVDDANGELWEDDLRVLKPLIEKELVDVTSKIPWAPGRSVPDAHRIKINDKGRRALEES